MKIIDLAIITPTLNEEHYIGKLLDSISKQTVQPKEIVIVDAFSEDNTIEEIKKRQKALHQLKYYQIQKYTIARQRNLGVKKTKSENILFLDADVLFKKDHILEDYFKNIESNRPDVSIVTNLPDSNHWKDKFLFKSADFMMKLLKPVWVTAVGINLYVSRKFFEKVNGFDEEIKVAEDFELVQRMVKNGAKYIIFSLPEIHSSVRRWRKYGRIRTFIMMIISGALISIVGYRKNPIHKKYHFGKHDPL